MSVLEISIPKNSLTISTTKQTVQIQSGQSKIIEITTNLAGNSGSSSSLPPGGTTGQILKKQSDTNGDASWETLTIPTEIPSGGSTGQILAKASPTNGDVAWATLNIPNDIPIGGLTGQVLTKQSDTDRDITWQSVPTPANELPSGGSTGQFLAKKTNANGDVEWVSASQANGVSSTEAIGLAIIFG